MYMYGRKEGDRYGKEGDRRLCAGEAKREEKERESCNDRWPYLFLSKRGLLKQKGQCHWMPLKRGKEGEREEEEGSCDEI